MVIATILSATPAWSQTDNSISAKVGQWRDRIVSDLGKWSINSNETIKKAEEEIFEHTGFRVHCDRGWSGLWGALSADNCAIGLTRINSALGQVRAPIDRAQLGRISIELGRPGLWQGITYVDREMHVPYNANPETIAGFVNSELNIFYGTSLADLIKSNENFRNKIKDQYFLQVDVAPILTAHEIHDGLRKVDMAMKIYFAGQAPTADEFRKLGLDTVVLNRFATPLMEESGRLRLGVNFKDHPGELFLDMIKAVRPDSRGKWLNSSIWTWSDVGTFRANRERVDRMKGELRKTLAVKQVECAMSYGDSGSIDMEDCRKGLESLQRAARNEALKNVGARGVEKILVKDLTLTRFDFDREHKVIELDYKIDDGDVLKAFQND